MINDIKRSKYLDKEPNFKPAQKPDVSHYEVYRGKNGDHYIEVAKGGDRRYYITKETPDGSAWATSSGSIGSYGTPEGAALTASQGPNGSSNTIINDAAADFNPGRVASFLGAAGLAGAAQTSLLSLLHSRWTRTLVLVKNLKKFPYKKRGLTPLFYMEKLPRLDCLARRR